jgi:hypothetical protein
MMTAGLGLRIRISNSYSGVVARLDRAIQYSRDGSALTRYHGVLDAPLSRGMTIEKHTSAISPRKSARVLPETSRPQIRGRRECRALDAPAASHAK